MSPAAADLVRKACGFALAIVLTLLLFRVLSRLATGTLSLDDPAIYGALLLAALGVLWVKAARRVRAEHGERAKQAPGAEAGSRSPGPDEPGQ